MSEYKLVPVEPTAEMVSAAEDAYMPFGDMELALRMALLAAPAVQKPAPDATGLVEALVAILEHDSPINIVDTATATERDIFDIARAALAAHRKQGGGA